MQFPTFLGQLRQLSAVDLGGASDSIDLEVPGFTLTCQEQTNWCWAAVTQAIERWQQNDVAQTDVASDHISRSRPGESCAAFNPQDVDDVSCAIGSCQSQCNSPHSLSAVLTERGRLRAGGLQPGLSFATVKAEIEGGRPVPCRIVWDAGNAHFVCVAGVSGSGANRFVHFYDPLSPGIGQGPADRFTMRFEAFRDRYVDRVDTAAFGTIEHSYLVE